MKEIVVDKNSATQKIEKFIRHYFKDAPLSFIYKAFRKKDIKVNGHWVNKDFVLKEGDVVRVYITDQQIEDFSKPKDVIKKDFSYEIVFEDENILIVNKPKGVLVIGDDKGSKDTLSNDVLNYLFFKGEFDPNNKAFIPSPAHRLDRNTSGLVLFGKNQQSLSELTQMFKDRANIHKIYKALVVGNLSGKGQINKPLKKDESTGTVSVCSTEKGGKNALTLYEVDKNYGPYCLLNVDLITGRTHQIRVHLSSIGHPIVGDNKYGDFADCKKVKKIFKLESQFLHAGEIRFDKIEGKLAYLSNKKFIGKLPNELNKILKELQN